MWKRVRRSETGQAVASWLIAWLIRLTVKSIRWKMVMSEATGEVLEAEAPIVGIFWHNRILMMPACWEASRPITLLRSPHRDGRLIGRAVEWLGYQTVSGSSNKGGAGGLRNLLKAIVGGRSIGITPDGPRGPRMRLSPGVVAAARLSGAPVIPAAWNVEHRKLLGTWDRMILARPFSRGVFYYGEPITVPKSLTAEEQEDYRLLIEERLNAVSRQADLHFGHAPIEPADLSDAREGRKSR